MKKKLTKNPFGFQKKMCLNTINTLTEKINLYVEEKDVILTNFYGLSESF